MLYRYSTDSNGKMRKTATIYTNSEHSIKLKNIDNDALRIVYQLHDYGYQAYIVGGAVRDLLLNKKPKDFDIVTDATPTQIKRIFRNSRIIGKRFRLVHVFFDQKIFEVSTFRSILNGSVGNIFGTIEEDSQRRDFSLNALYYDPIKEQIFDYVGAMQDIKNKKLVPIIPLERIFAEDPVRMIRAVKYSSTTGFKMSVKLKRKIKKSALLLLQVSASRLTEEFFKIINSGFAYKIILTSFDLNLLEYIQPNAYKMMKKDKIFKQNYLNSMKKLDELVINNTTRLGEKLNFVIQDFVDTLDDWESVKNQKSINVSEIYKNVWSECRSFVLPMNPQRTELEFAVKLALKNNGIVMKNRNKINKPKV